MSTVVSYLQLCPWKYLIGLGLLRDTFLHIFSLPVTVAGGIRSLDLRIMSKCSSTVLPSCNFISEAYYPCNFLLNYFKKIPNLIVFGSNCKLTCNLQVTSGKYFIESSFSFLAHWREEKDWCLAQRDAASSSGRPIKTGSYWAACHFVWSHFVCSHFV